jgi:hypothetical protein
MISARADEFFATMLGERGPAFRYFTAPVSGIADGALLPHAEGWEGLAFDTTPLDDYRACRPWLQLWAANAGSSTRCHYDVADNTFVQLSGRKEFWLWAPSFAADLHLFPDAHPRSRKSQLHFEPELADRWSGVPEPTRVVLGPGDAITIPAFWFHHVVSLTTCVSLNVFSESPCKLAAGALLSLDPPLYPAWPAEIRRAGLRFVVYELHQRIGLAASDSVDSILRTRYETLRVQEARMGEEEALTVVPAVDRLVAKRRRRRRRGGGPAPESMQSLLPHLSHFVDECVEAVRSIEVSVSIATAEDRLRWVSLGGDPLHGPGSSNSGDLSGASSSHYTPLEHFEALRDISIMHACELWALKLFGADALAEELRNLRQSL